MLIKNRYYHQKNNLDSNKLNYWQDFFVRCQKYTSANMPEIIDTFATLNPPATTSQIDALERKFNVALPESYKAFLAITNGINFSFFRNIEFLSLNNLDEFYLLKDYYPFLIEEWEETWEEQNKWYYSDELYNYFLNRNDEIVDINGEKQVYPPEGILITEQMFEHHIFECFNQPDTSQCWALPVRINYLRNLIIIGIQQDEGDCYCLNPNVKTSENEYEIWEIAPKLFDYPFIRYLNFIELMEYLLNLHIEDIEN